MLRQKIQLILIGSIMQLLINSLNAVNISNLKQSNLTRHKRQSSMIFFQKYFYVDVNINSKPML